MTDNSDETNCLYKMLLTDTQVSRLRKTFANALSDNMKLSKAQLSKMVQLERFLNLFNPFQLVIMKPYVKKKLHKIKFL